MCPGQPRAGHGAAPGAWPSPPGQVLRSWFPSVKCYHENAPKLHVLQEKGKELSFSLRLVPSKYVIVWS